MSDVYVLMFQVGPSANTMATCATLNRALQVAEEEFTMSLMSCGAAEYGPEAMAIYTAIINRVGTDDLALHLRKPLPRDISMGGEIWIDAVTKDGVTLQPAIITITKRALDQTQARRDNVKFVVSGPSAIQ